VDGGDLLGRLRHMTINHQDIPKVSPPGDLDSGLAHLVVLQLAMLLVARTEADGTEDGTTEMQGKGAPDPQLGHRSQHSHLKQRVLGLDLQGGDRQATLNDIS